MAERIKGRITRSLGGFYDVSTENGIYECHGRGLFRKDEIQLVVGDEVQVQPTEENRGSIVELLPRKNSLIRPPVSNIDRLALVVSVIDPVPNLYVIDKLTAIAARRNIEVVLIFTKIDRADATAYQQIYEQCGYKTCAVSSLTGEGIEKARKILGTGFVVLCGNTGAGKSSFMNQLKPDLELETGETSKKLGRGKHTTRHVQMYQISSNTWISDTPGFTAVEFLQYEKMTAEELEDCFPEFKANIPNCQFVGCSHRTEKGCAVLEAVKNHKIPKTRHENYKALYEELKKIKKWQIDEEKR